MNEYPYHLILTDQKVEVRSYVHRVNFHRYNWHMEEYEILVLLCGEADYHVGTSTYHLQAGDILLIPPEIGHSSYARQDFTLSLVIRFSENAYDPLLQNGESFQFETTLFSDHLSSETGSISKAAQLLRFFSISFFESLGSESTYAGFTSAALFQNILSILIENGSPIKRNALSEKKLRHRQTMQQLISYIRRNYDSKLSLSEVAKMFGYTPTYLSALFKQAFGITFHDYITATRLREATYLLVSTEQTLTEIALSCGFPDLNTFNTCFKRNYQVLPSVYRADCKSKKDIPLFRARDYYAPNYPVVLDSLSHFKYISMQDSL